jgi:hypothetical protein
MRRKGSGQVLIAMGVLVEIVGAAITLFSALQDMFRQTADPDGFGTLQIGGVIAGLLVVAIGVQLLAVGVAALFRKEP